MAIAASVLADKVRGCWLGKNIGGTLGGPFEGNKGVGSLTFYEPVPERPLPNDDLDLQLVWLAMLEELGGREPTLGDFAGAWLKGCRHYPWDEYGICLMNLEAGLRPPISGCFRNGYIDNMGSPIRSEIWACIAAGDPERAALLAMRDAVLDHAGGEGMYGEMFWAALQAGAFVMSDPRTLIRLGLSMIPLHCQIARVVREALVLHDRGLTWRQSRDKIAAMFSNPGERTRGENFVTLTDGGVMHPCHAVVNHGFTILGWLYGDDFGDMLCKAVNCGFDTDCSGATLGATLGIIAGAGGLPEKWLQPVGSGIVLHRYTGNLPGAPSDVDELTVRTLRVREAMAREGPKELWANARVRAALRAFDAESAVVDEGEASLTLHYFGEPVLYPNEPRHVEAELAVKGSAVEATLEVRGAPGWKVERQGRAWRVTSERGEGGHLEVIARWPSGEMRARFVFLPASEALWPVESNVPRCKVCTARAGACLC